MYTRRGRSAIAALICCLLLMHGVVSEPIAAVSAIRLGKERIVFQTQYGDLELALYPEVKLVMLNISLSVL